MADAVDGEIDDVGLADEAGQQREAVVDAAVMRDQGAAAHGDKGLELIDQLGPSADVENPGTPRQCFAEIPRTCLVGGLERRLERGELPPREGGHCDRVATFRFGTHALFLAGGQFQLQRRRARGFVGEFPLQVPRRVGRIRLRGCGNQRRRFETPRASSP